MFSLIYSWRGLHRAGQLISCPKQYGALAVLVAAQEPCNTAAFQVVLCLSLSSELFLEKEEHWTTLLPALSEG